MKRTLIVDTLAMHVVFSYLDRLEVHHCQILNRVCYRHVIGWAQTRFKISKLFYFAYPAAEHLKHTLFLVNEFSGGKKFAQFED